MSKCSVTNKAASVRQRLLNLAKASGRPFNEVLQHYALERWLYRLSRSEHAERFVLKGALLLRVWDVAVGRPTRDIDLLARTSNDLDSVRTVVEAICGTSVEDDGMEFDSNSVTTERISEDADYEGVRATFGGSLGTARCPMQIDMGFSDVVTPRPVEIDYPTILDLPAPHLRAYIPAPGNALGIESAIDTSPERARHTSPGRCPGPGVWTFWAGGMGGDYAARRRIWFRSTSKSIFRALSGLVPASSLSFAIRSRHEARRRRLLCQAGGCM